MKDFFAVPFLIIAVVAAIIFAVNFSNEKIDGGYAGYVYSEPIFGSKEFKQVIKGPGSTGMVWRQNSIKICVTPYTQTETFDDVRSSDQLKMKAESYLVYRIDSEKVKEFVENYGAISETVRSPEAIAQDAYASFIQQPFRTEVRSAIAKFKGLEAPSRIPEITKMVETNLKKQLNGTPFIVESVTIGSTIPPESVTLGITKKVEATQEYERQATQLKILINRTSLKLQSVPKRLLMQKAGQLPIRWLQKLKVSFFRLRLNLMLQGIAENKSLWPCLLKRKMKQKLFLL